MSTMFACLSVSDAFVRFTGDASVSLLGYLHDIDSEDDEDDDQMTIENLLNSKAIKNSKKSEDDEDENESGEEDEEDTDDDSQIIEEYESRRPSSVNSLRQPSTSTSSWCASPRAVPTEPATWVRIVRTSIFRETMPTTSQYCTRTPILERKPKPPTAVTVR